MATSTSQLLLLMLQASLGLSLVISTLPNSTDLSHVISDDFNQTSPSHPFNADLNDPPDPLTITWDGGYSTVFNHYTEPKLDSVNILPFIDRAKTSLHLIRLAKHAQVHDPIPGGLFIYESEVFTPMMIRFQIGLDPPWAPWANTLSYAEAEGVIVSIGPYMRRWRGNSPASAAMELWKHQGPVSEQKASGYIFGFPLATGQ